MPAGPVPSGAVRHTLSQASRSGSGGLGLSIALTPGHCPPHPPVQFAREVSGAFPGRRRITLTSASICMWTLSPSHKDTDIPG